MHFFSSSEMMEIESYERRAKCMGHQNNSLRRQPPIPSRLVCSGASSSSAQPRWRQIFPAFREPLKPWGKPVWNSAFFLLRNIIIVCVVRWNTFRAEKNTLFLELNCTLFNFVLLCIFKPSKVVRNQV